MISELIDFLALPPDYRPIIRRTSSFTKNAAQESAHLAGIASGVKRGKRRRLEMMDASFAELERHRLLHTRLLEELVHRRLLRPGGWSHRGYQFCTEPTSLALLALSSRSDSSAAREALRPLLPHRLSDGTWPAVADAVAVNFWTTALAVNTLMILEAVSDHLKT